MGSKQAKACVVMTPVESMQTLCLSRVCLVFSPHCGMTRLFRRGNLVVTQHFCIRKMASFSLC